LFWRSRPESNRHPRIEGPRSSPLDDGNRRSKRQTSKSRCAELAPVLPHPKLSKNNPLFPDAMPERRASALLAQKFGTPPGIRTPISMFLKHARMPIPPAEQKKPGVLTDFRALEKKKPGALARSGLGGKWRDGANFPPVPDACRPRRVPGDPWRNTACPLAGW
jgi:hypothetical protein